MREALDRTRPLGADVLMGVFQIAMAEATDKAMSRTIRGVARRKTTQGEGGKARPKSARLADARENSRFQRRLSPA